MELVLKMYAKESVAKKLPHLSLSLRFILLYGYVNIHGYT